MATTTRQAETSGWWKVVTWKHANCGGESLVFRYEPGQPFCVATGPTPWGSGSWGPFPAECVTAARDIVAGDSWPVSGCPSERWTPATLLQALVYGDDGREQERTRQLRQAIARAAAA